MSDPRFFRKYIDILNEADVPQPTAPQAPTPPTAPTAQPAATPAGAQPPANLPKLVTPTAEQLKAQYKDVGAVGPGITSQGRSPEELAQDKAQQDQAYAKYTATIDSLKQQGKTKAAEIYQKTADRMKAQWDKQQNDPEYFGKHDPNNIGTINATNSPWARLVDAVRGQTGPAYTGKDVDPAEQPEESGWESMAKALALPAGQALFLNGNVAPSLLYKLNPWAKDPAVEQAVLATLPDINQIMRGNIG